MSYGYTKKEAERLRADIESLVTQAQQQDESDDAALGSRRGDELPSELKRREDRLTRIESAMRRLEAQAKAEAEAERQRRAEAEAERKRTGQQRRGKAPKPVEDTPDAKAQMSFTDPELHIMRTKNKGWEYCGNAQVRVDGTCHLTVAPKMHSSLASRINSASEGIRRPLEPLVAHLCSVAPHQFGSTSGAHDVFLCFQGLSGVDAVYRRDSWLLLRA